MFIIASSRYRYRGKRLPLTYVVLTDATAGLRHRSLPSTLGTLPSGRIVLCFIFYSNKVLKSIGSSLLFPCLPSPRPPLGEGVRGGVRQQFQAVRNGLC